MPVEIQYKTEYFFILFRPYLKVQKRYFTLFLNLKSSFLAIYGIKNYFFLLLLNKRWAGNKSN